MKKLIFLLLILLEITTLNAQNTITGVDTQKNSIGGMFENVFDQYGNKYSLADLKIGTPRKSKINGETLSTSLICTSGIFDLHFETGCGMDVVTNTTQNTLNTARRTAACQVFSDLSNFINSPLKNIGNTTRVKIWVRNIDQVTSSSNGVLGLATSFYNLPYNIYPGFGGIADNEIWKTIHAGSDSFINVAQPLISSGINSGVSGLFFHGMMSFNFNTITNWNTNLGINTPSGQYDLYSVILHEVTHALGFASLISANGSSKFGTGYNYYSRYDRLLKNNIESQFLISNSGSCNLYNYAFNPTLSSAILQPNTPCIKQQTTCATAIKFVGTSTVPVFTPNCFDPPSSLSHFEDQCIGLPNGNNNNAYFVMTDANGTGVTKRFLKPEERNALGDIGYSLNSTFGNNILVLNSFKDYSSITTGVNVAGINDGINPDGTFKYFGNVGDNIQISGILDNDYSATSFECLEHNISSNISVSSGNSNTIINFSNNFAGIYLLRYIPVNTLGQKGNITYIYVYVRQINNCATPNFCDLVVNGGFEQYSTIPQNLGELNACGWSNPRSSSSPDYFHTNSTAAANGLADVPCNAIGFQNTNINSGLGYAGLLNINNQGNNGFFGEVIQNKLSSQILKNVKYQLSFDISLAEGHSAHAVKLQVYLSTTQINLNSIGSNLPNLNRLYSSPMFTTNTNEWKKVIIDIPSDLIANENFLLIGGIKYDNFEFFPLTPASQNVGGCGYGNFNQNQYLEWKTSYYFIDNVSLIPLNQTTFDLPSSVCKTQIFTNLKNYISPSLNNGIFSGNGVVYSNNIYSFNSTNAGLGVHTITYSYTNNLGCLVNLYSNVNVSDCTSTSCPGNLIFDNQQTISSANYQAANSIITNTNYLVNAGSTITLKAGNYITFSPSSEVKAGSTSNFTAQITNCTQTSARNSTKDKPEGFAIDKSNIDVKMYPNPFEKIFNIQVTGNEISKIKITTLDGKIISNLQNIKSEISAGALKH